ncbi:sh3 domain containing protein [Niveomyces insectorum RCEF 264]|uniref:Sh3 domain containing protein n=1 Tax=Niveomyces insectorum RCEF 264 TaxID=1081102 RepID=A0A167PTU6_9HYPO|nr:sh3 domain containing protein [Niveomyces insectorum RCEF 264]
MFKVKAIYEYASPHDDDLQFPAGQIITVTEEEDAEWYVGEYTDDSGAHHEGLFPRNFVEKYEPVAPPRPTRTRTAKKDVDVAAATSPGVAPRPSESEAPAIDEPASPPVPPVPPVSAVPTALDEEFNEEDEPRSEKTAPLPSPPATTASAAPTLPPPPKAPEPKSPASAVAASKATEPAPRPAPSSAAKPSPPSPPASEKPSSFRDRIAAFNKAAAPPITPYKPSGLGGGSSSNFIKKPFVAPPPSRNSYVPPPREAPAAKLYRRDEDPEIKERVAENQETAERAGLVPGSSSTVTGTSAGSGGGGGGDGEDEEPRPMMSLKERMARLQREQQEQASRHAEAAAKKEKPKRPPKKRLDSHDAPATGATPDEATTSGSAPPPPLERRDTGDTIGRRSVEETHVQAHPPRMAHPPRRKASRDPGVESQDGNDADMSGAGDTTEGQDDEVTERDESDEKSRHLSKAAAVAVPSAGPPGGERRSAEHVHDEDEDESGTNENEADERDEKEKQKGEDGGGEEDEEEEEGEEEEEEEDPEARRREELRARMAKMSGGMGMMGMQGMQGLFGAPPPIKKKKALASERHTSEAVEEAVSSPSQRAPPVPVMMALPGMTARRSEDRHREQDETDPDAEQRAGSVDEPRSPSLPIRSAAPPVPGSRPVPPPPPPQQQQQQQTSALDIKSPSEGSASDDELSEQTPRDDLETPRGEVPAKEAAPPPPPPASVPPSRAVPTSPRPSRSGDATTPVSPTSQTQNKRASRLPPPIPGAAPAPPPAQTRPPPPPPPGALSRQSTSDARSPLSPTRSFPSATAAAAEGGSDDEEEEEITEYEGDYDTDIANPLPHKNSLKSHARDSSLEDSASLKSPTSEVPPSLPPPVPGAARAPPPIPNQPPPLPSLPPSQPPPPPADKRRSVDVPRGPPPPPPPPPPSHQQSSATRYGEDYDPYNYSAAPTSPGVPISGYASSSAPKSFLDDSYTPPDLSLSSLGGSTASASARGSGQHPPGPPPPPPPPPPSASQSSSAAAMHHGSRSTRPSVDLPARGGATGRRSVDVNRPSMESGFIAGDLDLAPLSGWWLQPHGLPPQLQGRSDIFHESEESQTAKRGGKMEITRDIYVLYQDYSQTVITVQFDPSDAAADAQLAQRHEPPPRSLRQDQLEQAYERFGRHIADTVLAKKDTVVGDGSPQALVRELVRPYRDALLPVGTRAYGALVYANLANASTVQTDAIRAGDIVTLRNARFQGKHGAMHAKYSMEVGKPDHVAVVSEWDGTKKKVRAWEQGRETKKVKLESFKLDDLRSGEVKIWRVMPRSWEDDAAAAAAVGRPSPASAYPALPSWSSSPRSSLPPLSLPSWSLFSSSSSSSSPPPPPLSITVPFRRSSLSTPMQPSAWQYPWPWPYQSSTDATIGCSAPTHNVAENDGVHPRRLWRRPWRDGNRAAASRAHRSA